MITRSVCKITEEYDKNLVNHLSDYVSNPIIEDNYSLRNLIKLNPQIHSDNVRYISGRLYYQKIVPIMDFEIDDDGEITENDSKIRKTLFADFWIKQNPGTILFSNAESSESGSKIFSKILWLFLCFKLLVQD